LRCAQYVSVEPSGEMPCQYDGAFGVTSFGVPPVIGSV
jgi:hypothetical protein